MNRNHLAGLFLTLAISSTATSLATAQEGLTWPGIRPTPNAILVQVDRTHIDVYLPGFATYKNSTDGGDVGVGVGTQQGPARTVTKHEFKEENNDEPERVATPSPGQSPGT